MAVFKEYVLDGPAEEPIEVKYDDDTCEAYLQNNLP